MSISRALGQKNQPPNALEATWKDPVAEKQTAKSRRKRIWKDASRSCIPQEGGAIIYIYIYIICIYIYIHIYTSLSLSLSLFAQVKLLERA